MKLKDRLEGGEVLNRNGNRFPFAGILVAIAFVAILFYGVVGEDKFLLLSPLAILGYACLVLWMAMAAFSRRSASVAPPGFFLFLLFIIYGAALGTVSIIPYEAKIRMLGIGLFVGAYYLWGNSFALFRRSRAVLGWVMLFALLGCFYGLINFFKQPEMVLWIERYAPYAGRLASTYICPNHFAHLLQMLLPFCLVLMLIPKAGLFLRILSGYSFLMFLPALFLTESRAGWLGSMAAVGVTVCLLALRKSRKLFLLLVILVPLCLTLLLFGGWRYSETFQRRMQPVVTFLEGQADSGVGSEARDFRPQTWMDTMDMVKEKPATGFGPASYRYTFPEHRKRCGAVRVVTGHPHNEYLEIASEYGLIGFGLFALAWCYGLVRLLVFSLKTQNQHHAFMAMAFLGTAAGTMLHSFFDFQMHVFQNALVFSLLAAIAAGPLCGRRQEALLKGNGHGFWPKLLRPARLALAVVAIAGLLLSLQAFSSAFIRAAADRLAEARQPEKAKRYYDRAIKIDPSNWRAYKGLGLVYYNERYYSLDRDEKNQIAAVERAVLETGCRFNPKDASLLVGLGRVTIFSGDVDAGIERLKQSTELRPFNDNYWWMLGVAQRKAGRYEEALETFQYARGLKNSASIRKNIQWLEKQLRMASAKVESENEVQESPAPADDPAGTSLDDLYKLMEGF
ncbi:MAG: O-antigen ligase family protein [Verrucomicrobia bacterium]|nr:O-antigen ligase family protein [Verrucomicrobiota bacterium]